jgi:molybdopterin-guanine dinucleotide biosynthesis protein B
MLLGFAGWSGSGKTTLLTAVLPLLRARGLTVSTIKHAHHDLDLDRPGKDSFRHREAGAAEVLVIGGHRWALLRETGDEEPDLQALAARLEPVDLVLVEGFKASPFPKIEVWRPAAGNAPQWSAMPSILAVATDAPGIAAELGCPHPLLDINDAAAIAIWIAGWHACQNTKP